MPKKERLKKHLVYFLELIPRTIKHYAAGRIYTPQPRFFALKLSNRCNAKCIMCSIWRRPSGKEPTINDIRDIFADPFMSCIKDVGFFGGEPTLREDLPAIAQTICRANPHLNGMDIISNGLSPTIAEKRVNDILSLPEISRLRRFSVSISLDGFGDVHEKIRRVPQAFEKANETLVRLKRLQQIRPFSLGILCTVQKLNVDNLKALDDYAREINIPIAYNPVTHLCGSKDNFENELVPDVSDLDELEGFIMRNRSLNLPSKAFWSDYFRMRQGKRRSFPCAHLHTHILMLPDGNLHFCGTGDFGIFGNIYEDDVGRLWSSNKAKQVREWMRKEVCPFCNMANNPAESLSHDVLSLAKTMFRAGGG